MDTNDSEFWKRKLAAFLHDPPSKPLNIADHRNIAETLCRNAGLQPEEAKWLWAKVSDHTAAAADRIVCPKPSVLNAKWNQHDAFRHPLGGGKMVIEGALSAAEAETRVAAAQLRALGQVTSSKEKFFLQWRLWPKFCAQEHTSLLYLPADTRIPDHSTWTHCSIVSALQGCVEIEGEGQNMEIRHFEPAFVLFQIGPVQEFIEQARTTRDCWSGSYLLSWLIAHGLKAVSEEIGPDSVIFPSLRGQPLFDFLHRKFYEAAKVWNDIEPSQEQILTPNFPNRFLVVTSSNRAKHIAEVAKRAMELELENISSACLNWVGTVHGMDKPLKDRWVQQVRQFLTIHWQFYPWEVNVETAIDRFNELPAGRFGERNSMPPGEGLKLSFQAAREGIPGEHLDPRNYKHTNQRQVDGSWKSTVVLGEDGKPMIDNPGFAWAAHFAEIEFRLAARRNTRNFEPWGELEVSRAGFVKDVLSGKEEAIGDAEWQKELSNKRKNYFRPGERLGALNIIKRVWHEAYLRGEPHNLNLTPKYESVPAVAAAVFVEETLEKLGNDAEAWSSLLDFQSKASNAAGVISARIDKSDNEEKWLQKTDAAVFHIPEWEGELRVCESENDRRTLLAAIKSLTGLHGALKQQPSRYVAVLAMDGDSMGQWVSGAKSPKYRSQLSEESVRYFAETVPAREGTSLAAMLEAPRHVSPSYHLQFSEALANFSIYLAGPIVRFFHGQILYSGGDDILAMLPAETALACAETLRKAFQGDPELWRCFGLVEEKAPFLPMPSESWGFVGIRGDSPLWSPREARFLPRGYQLLVPGRNADISAGIAVGHMHAPLQNIIAEARHAEKRAKSESRYNKAAFSMTLLKRSGETREWGARWDENAIELARCFKTLRTAEKVSNKFPYALAELLEAYAQPAKDECGNIHPWQLRPSDSFNVEHVFKMEMAHVCSRQGSKEWRNSPECGDFQKLFGDYLRQLVVAGNRTIDDLLGPLMTTSFLERSRE